MAEKALHLQQKIRENSQEFNDFLNDLNRWEKDIKKKDEDLKKEAAIEQINTAPIRKKFVQKEKKNAKNNEAKSSRRDTTTATKNSRISSYDYDSWSKFDVEAACTEIDKTEENLEENDEDESDEEDLEVDLEIEQQKRLQRAIYEKDKGNDLFKDGKYEAAVNRYTIASELDPRNAIIFANRAMALIKLERYAAAEVDCTSSLSLDPEYAKAVARRATARTKLKKLQEAKQDLEHLLQLQPNNKQASMDLEKLNKELSKKEKQKDSDTKRKRRSNKPLKRIIIEDVGTEEEAPASPENVERNVNNQKNTKKLENDTQPHATKDPDCQKTVKPNERETAVSQVMKTQINMQIPTSSVQFETDLRKIKKDLDDFYTYFAAIPTNLYKSLLYHSVDEVLPLALECFYTYYRRDSKEYWKELSCLTEVPRFDMARMFLSKNSQKIVKSLFQELRNKHIDDPENTSQILDLAKKYGVSF